MSRAEMQTAPRNPGKRIVATVRCIARSPAAIYGRIRLELNELSWAMRPPAENTELRERLDRLAANPPKGWQVMYDPTAEDMLARAAAIQTDIAQRQAHAADLQNRVLEQGREESRRVTVLTKAVVILSVLVVLSSMANLVALLISLL